MKIRPHDGAAVFHSPAEQAAVKDLVRRLPWGAGDKPQPYFGVEVEKGRAQPAVSPGINMDETSVFTVRPEALHLGAENPGVAGPYARFGLVRYHGFRINTVEIHEKLPFLRAALSSLNDCQVHHNTIS
ncbi:hypothetical protein SDC9_136521 [bioreactor metagenome]|uniref:Uncharacterized protein n=1 Tax=bioreactor metagenome TaxID=1076179 RepID=A0A645DLI3_9ZZZZ